MAQLGKSSAKGAPRPAADQRAFAGKYRVNGVVRNVDAWYKAFNVQPGDKMYLPPEQRVHVW